MVRPIIRGILHKYIKKLYALRDAKFHYLAYFFAVLILGASFANAEVGSSALAERRAQLDAQLRAYEQQIDEYQNLVAAKQQEGESLKRDIDILTAKIASAKLALKARTLAITRLTTDIGEKSEHITVLAEKIEKTKLSLGEFLRKIKENDSYSAIELALVYKDVSQFFDELESIDTLQGSLQEAMGDFVNFKKDEEDARAELQDKKNEELELKAIQELEKKTLERNEREKQRILKETKGKESEYQKTLKEKQKNAAAIRSQLFLLSGSTAIPFEKALEFARFAQQATGIRPAFLLGLITEESNLGQNVGKGNWREDLSHRRCASQREAFVAITSELGLDPDKMPVSKKAWYGYCGGAMGPAQFIPTTWQLFKNRIAKITGHNPPSPWDPQDAFVGAGLLLTDNGARAGNYDSEWKAAMKYLAGVNWSKKAYRFYGDDVMAIAVKYQEQIDLLQSVAQR